MQIRNKLFSKCKADKSVQGSLEFYLYGRATGMPFIVTPDEIVRPNLPCHYVTSNQSYFRQLLPVACTCGLILYCKGQRQ